MLDRKRMEEILKNGGSVTYGGKVVSDITDLPPAEELAQTPEQKAELADDLRGQIDDLSQRLRKVEDGPSELEKALRLIAEHEATIETLKKGDKTRDLNAKIAELVKERDGAKADLGKALAELDKTRAELANAKAGASAGQGG